MAQIGKVSVAFTASTGQLQSGVAAAGRAFKALGGNATELRSSLANLRAIGSQGFDQIGPAAEAASRAFMAAEQASADLGAQFKDGKIKSDQFREAMGALVESTNRTVALLQRGVQITQQNQTAQEDYAKAVAELTALKQAGAIADEIYNRELARQQAILANADGTTAAAAAAAKQLADAQQQAAAIVSANQTAQERYNAAIAAAKALLDQDVLGVEAYNRELLRQQAILANADGTTAAAAAAAKQLADAQQQAAAIVSANQTAQERYNAAIEKARGLYESGQLGVEAYNREVTRQQAILANADGTTAAAANAAKQLADVQSRGAAVTRANMNAQEQYQAKVADLRGLLAAGAITQETFNRAVANARSGMQNAGSAAKGMESGLSGITSRLNALIALDVTRFFADIVRSITNGISSLVRFGAAQAEVVDKTGKLAERLGFTYGQFAGLTLAAELADVSMEQIGAAATTADVAFVKAAQGSKQAVDAFSNIGLAVEDLNGLSAAERFQKITDAIATLPTEAERARAAVQLFGRSGAELLPLFNQGAGAVANATEQANKFGLALTNSQQTNIQKMNDSFKEVWGVLQGITQQVVAQLSPAVSAIAETFTAFVSSYGGANIGQGIAGAIFDAGDFLAQTIDTIIANFGSTFEYLSKVWQQAGSVVDVFNRTTSFLSGVWNTAKVILGSIIIGFTGAFQGLATIAQKIGRYLGFDTKSIDKVVAGAKAFNQSLEKGITDSANKAAKDFKAAFATETKPLGEALAGPVTTAFRAARRDAEDAAKQIDEARKQTVEVKQVVQLDGLKQAVQGIDSRSAEGVKEMFRLMRGDTGNAAERTANAAERTADGIDELVNGGGMGVDIVEEDIAA